MAAVSVFVLMNILECDEEDDQNIIDEDDVSTMVMLALGAASTERKERNRIDRNVEEVVPFYHADDFKRSFRMCRATFEVVCQNLSLYQELLPSWTGGREHVKVEKQLLIVLWYLATQETTHNIADRFDVTESTVVKCRDSVFRVFTNHLKTKFISWPEGNTRQEVVDGFRRKANFPGVIGAIDGTHIRIKAPKEGPLKAYVNRKGFHLVLLQAVCRDDMRFTHVVAGWPGSCHDARVVKNCDLWDNGLAMCGDGHVIGDAAYPLRRWLITPFRDNGHLNAEQRAFNISLSTTRVTIERAFGLLKGRFPRLQCVNTRKVKSAVDASIVCTIIQNICLLNLDEMQDYFEDNYDVPVIKPCHFQWRTMAKELLNVIR